MAALLSITLNRIYPMTFLLVFLPLEEIRNPRLTSVLDYILVTIKSVLTALRVFCFFDSPLFFVLCFFKLYYYGDDVWNSMKETFLLS